MTISSASDTTADNGQWAITSGNEVYSSVRRPGYDDGDWHSRCVLRAGVGYNWNFGNLTGVTGTLETITYGSLTGGFPLSTNSPLTTSSFDTTGGTRSGFVFNLGVATSTTDLALLLSDLGESATTSSVTQDAREPGE